MGKKGLILIEPQNEKKKIETHWFHIYNSGMY